VVHAEHVQDAVHNEQRQLVVHGILHVLGMDHASPEEEEEMQAKERSLLERFHHKDP